MIHLSPFAAWPLLIILSLVFWPDTSLAVFLIALTVYLVRLPWCYTLRAYYRFRLYLIDRELRRIARRRHRLVMSAEETAS